MQNIKNIIFIGLILLIGIAHSSAQNNDNSFTLTGEIKGLNGNLYYRHPDKKYDRATPSDSIVVNNGKFTLTTTVSELSMLRIFPSFRGADKKLSKIPKGGKGYLPVKCASIMVYASPGAHVTINGEAKDFFDAYPSGNAYNDGLAKVNKLMYPMYNEMGNLAVQTTYEEEEVKKEAINKESEAIFKKSIDALTDHIKNNPNDLASAWYLNDLMLRTQISNDQAKMLFSSLSTDLAEYSDYQNVSSRIQGIKTTADGFPVPSIKTNATLNGKEFDITSLRGKYVLIDFWGIWCRPCMAEMPIIKQFQEKHKDKLVVIGINSGDTKEKIQKFVQEHDYTWLQLMSDKKNTADNFVNRFNVQGFPTKFIVDMKGKIIKRIVGNGEEAFNLLEDLLSK
ncbi:TlpA disulfide reductase family protein [Maribacter polysaccharolyticus]|uniref:TlpA disulfide reductase family protein n=1 Tax=Maribacter polysaccharolyticus TaxID=3020831 RepID=UPI00237FCB79|nr:TlpA disulfide reductase family protein [Maribacter polysaccharolyticus]MDE3742777.1 TlpA disulfide reductase family protein [Maribacter polysaccharolyticus]